MNVKSPILLLLLYVYAECVHMKARILGFNEGSKKGWRDGYRERCDELDRDKKVIEMKTR
jgi:hypothetical protein